MLTKIKSFIRYLVLIIALITSYSLIKSISKLTGANQKIVNEEKYLSDLKKENDELTKKLQNVESVQFIEEIARNKLGLAKKGEIVVVLPDTQILKNLSPKLPIEKATLPDPNWTLWLKLFL